MKKIFTVIVITSFLAVLMGVGANFMGATAYACDDTDPSTPGMLKIQGFSIVDDQALMEGITPYLMECNCAEVLTILLENSFQIANVTGIQGPPGVVYTLVRNTPGFSNSSMAANGLPGVAILKCGKAGSCSGTDGGCDSGSTGEEPHTN